MSNLPSYLAVLVAAIVAWIGYQQFRLAREQVLLARIQTGAGTVDKTSGRLMCVITPSGFEGFAFEVGSANFGHRDHPLKKRILTQEAPLFPTSLKSRQRSPATTRNR
jgi:hypothetical protein